MRMRKSIIEFVDVTNYVPEHLYPKPAKAVLPEWYKKTQNYRDNKKELYQDERGTHSGTVKKCMPFFDALTSGYLLLCPSDLQIQGSIYNKTFKASNDKVSSHGRWQLGEFPLLRENENAPKLFNPWGIITPKGYSCMFINPLNRHESPITFLEGVVDTDTYHNPVNFPFYLKDREWEGVIAAGTPIIQVIPFKRESYSHKISLMKDSKINYVEKIETALQTKIFNGYKSLFWSKKDYS
jgi:hypothetical protein